MNITYRRADISDCKILIQIYDEAYFTDYIRFGECPGYKISEERMEKSIMDEKTEKYIICTDDKEVGSVSIVRKSEESYFLSNLCIIPEFQNKGIGQRTIDFVLEQYEDLQELTLVTPVEKDENMRFYIEKCGFSITGYQMDGLVKLACFSYQKSCGNSL